MHSRKEKDKNIQVDLPDEEEDAKVKAAAGEAKDQPQKEIFVPIEVHGESQAPPSGGEEPPSPTTPEDKMACQTEHTEITVNTERPKSLTLPDNKTTTTATASIDQRQVVLQPTVAISPQPSTSSQRVAPLYSPNESFDSAIARSSRSSVDSGTSSDPARSPGHFVIVAIDFGTTFSGYAFSFTRDPDSIHMMRKWEGGDPGVINQKTPTSLLLTPEGKFHSFGFSARDNFHDLDYQESKRWLYFEKFKMTLHYNSVSSSLFSEQRMRGGFGSGYLTFLM